MKVTPLIIAGVLIDAVESGTPQDQACDGCIALLREHCPSVTLRDFAHLLQRELERRHEETRGLLIVPSERSMTARHIEEQISQTAGRSMHIDRAVDPELIGGAVLHLEHQRIDASVQGALQHLHSLCLAPIDA